MAHPTNIYGYRRKYFTAAGTKDITVEEKFRNNNRLCTFSMRVKQKFMANDSREK